jgi:hypothetical protein
MVVHERFHLLEGVTLESEVHILAVAFDAKELVDFVAAIAASKVDRYIAYRISSHGGFLQEIGVPQPTHEAPVTPN